MSTSDKELIRAMEIHEDDSSSLSEDDLLNAAMDIFELNQIYEEGRDNQREYQRHLIEQSGGQIDPNAQGRFVFDLQPLQIKPTVGMVFKNGITASI